MPTLPATAADASHVELSVAVANLTVAPGTEGQTVGVTLFTNQPEAVVLRDLTLRIDATGLGDAATVVPTSEVGCETEGPITTCTEFDPFPADPEGFGWKSLQVKAADGAEIGRTGTFTLTVSATGVKPAGATSTVTVGDAVNLTNVRDVQATSRPGHSVKAPVAVRNTGDKPVNGVDLLMFFPTSIGPAKRYQNCDYSDRFAVCHFGTTLTPGTEYALAEPLPVQVGTDAWAPKKVEAEVFWVTPADAETWWGGHKPDFTRGTAAPLTLVESKPAQTKALGQTDPRPEDNWGRLMIDVKGRNEANFVAIGDALQGGVGSIVTAKVGVRNDGPASVENRSGNAIRHVTIELPAGTTSLTAAKDCAPFIGKEPDFEQKGKPGAKKYTCHSDWIFLKGEKLIWEFRLRIDNADSPAGKVTSTYGFVAPDKPKPDLNPADDIARITVNAAPPGGGGSDELPRTGAAIAGMVGVGSALIGLGAAILVMARRRRSQPVLR